MTDTFDPIPDPDDRPVGVALATTAPAATAAPAPAVARAPTRPRASRWGRVFRWWLGLSMLTFVGIAVCAFIGLSTYHFDAMHITVDGTDLSDGLVINGLSDGARALVAITVGLVALFIILLVPLILLVVLGSLLIALVCGIVVPLLALALVLAVATSPLWLTGLLVWLMLRRRDSHRLAASATMPA